MQEMWARPLCRLNGRVFSDTPKPQSLSKGSFVLEPEELEVKLGDGHGEKAT